MTKKIKVYQDLGNVHRHWEFETETEALAYAKKLFGFVTVNETDDVSHVKTLYRNFWTKGRLTIVSGKAA